MRKFGRNQATRDWIEQASTKADDVAGRIDDVLVDTLESSYIIRLMRQAWAMTIANELEGCDEEVFIQDVHAWLETRHREFSDPKYAIALELIRQT